MPPTAARSPSATSPTGSTRCRDKLWARGSLCDGAPDGRYRGEADKQGQLALPASAAIDPGRVKTRSVLFVGGVALPICHLTKSCNSRLSALTPGGNQLETTTVGGIGIKHQNPVIASHRRE
jgi:hypothetical protein